MSILVDPNARFKIEFYYEEIYDNDKQIGILILNEFDNIKSDEELKILKSKINYIDWNHFYKFEGIFKVASHDEMSEIREDSSCLNHRNEKAMLRNILFRPKVVSRLCVDWNLVHKNSFGDEVKLPITEDVCRKMYEHILIEIINRWAQKIGAHRKRKIDVESNTKD